jgi:hypothetical protein
MKLLRGPSSFDSATTSTPSTYTFPAMSGQWRCARGHGTGGRRTNCSRGGALAHGSADDHANAVLLDNPSLWYTPPLAALPGQHHQSPLMHTASNHATTKCDAALAPPAKRNQSNGSSRKKHPGPRNRKVRPQPLGGPCSTNQSAIHSHPSCEAFGVGRKDLLGHVPGSSIVSTTWARAPTATYPVFQVHGHRVTLIDSRLKILVVDLVTPEACDEIVRCTDRHVAQVERCRAMVVQHPSLTAAAIPAIDQSCPVIQAATKNVHETLASLDSVTDAASLSILPQSPPSMTWRKLYTYSEFDLPCHEVPGLMTSEGHGFVDQILLQVKLIIGGFESHRYKNLAYNLHPRSRNEPHLLKYHNLPGIK